MITQIEIDGFKTFKDFKVELAPFQVIVGPNGSGKSNLFDALHLLSHLMDDDIASAFQVLRGRDYEQFTALPDGKYADRIHMAVEMLVDRKVQDDLGREVELKYTRLRYELAITLRTDDLGLERFYVTHESLEAIPREKDSWCRKHNLSSQNNWLPELTGNQATFISTTLPTVRVKVAEAKASYDADPSMPSTASAADTVTISLHQDGQRKGETFVADKVKRTVLSSVTDTDSSHAFATREEIRSWRFLHLNPEVLRQPSSTKARPFLSPNGGNLPATLARIQAQDHFAFHWVWLDLANLVPGIIDIKLDKDQASNEYVIRVKTDEQRSFSSRVLSDGTLRLLALATMSNDPQLRGVLCLEEPENGVHPSRLKNMARLLRETATDFRDSEQTDEPLRQVLVTTHSPAFISQPDVVDSLLFAYTVTQIVPGQPILDVTRMIPITTQKARSLVGTDIDKAEASYTLDEVKKYLNSEVMNNALIHLAER